VLERQQRRDKRRADGRSGSTVDCERSGGGQQQVGTERISRPRGKMNEATVILTGSKKENGKCRRAINVKKAEYGSRRH